MQDRSRVYIIFCLIVVVLVIFLASLISMFRGPRLISPLPEESPINIIYITPTVTPMMKATISPIQKTL